MTFDTELKTVDCLKLHVVRTCISFRNKHSLMQLYVPLDLFARQFS